MLRLIWRCTNHSTTCCRQVLVWVSRSFLALAITCRWGSDLLLWLMNASFLSTVTTAIQRADLLVIIEPLLFHLVVEWLAFLGAIVGVVWIRGDRSHYRASLTQKGSSNHIKILLSLLLFAPLSFLQRIWTYVQTYHLLWLRLRRLGLNNHLLRLEMMTGLLLLSSNSNAVRWCHTKNTKLGHLTWIKDRLALIHSPSCVATSTDHLLVGHNVFHDQLLVFFSNGLAQFLLILAYQVLNVDVVALIWWVELLLLKLLLL